jgi:hypothetical protein
MCVPGCRIEGAEAELILGQRTPLPQHQGLQGALGSDISHQNIILNYFIRLSALLTACKDRPLLTHSGNSLARSFDA